MVEIKLVIFLIFVQAAIGTMIFAMISDKMSTKSNLKTPMIVTALLSVIGFMAFVFYLGSPTFIFNTLSQLSHSWLSREILFTIIFIGLAIISVCVQFLRPEVKRFGWAAGIIGFIDVILMVNVCRATSVAAWKSLNTYVDFLASTIILGITILFILNFHRLENKTKKILAYTGLAAVVIQVASTIYSYLKFGHIIENINGILMAQSLLLILGAVLLFLRFPGKQEENNLSKSNARNYLGAAAICCGLIVNRYLFYAIFIAAKGWG